jgi:hypothetical protein
MLVRDGDTKPATSKILASIPGAVLAFVGSDREDVANGPTISAPRENKMTWTHHHDPIVGVFDYPGHNDSSIIDYWTNESGVRIGFWGHAKGIARFTYKCGAINFLFDVLRAPGQVPDQLEDRTLGPICKVYIWEDHPIHLGSRYGQYEINNIKEFLPHYRDPRFPSPVAIETVLFGQPEEFYNNSYKDDSNG